MAQYSSSPSLSSPPSGSISDPGSPSRLHQGRANIAMGDEIVVDTAAQARFGLLQQSEPQPNVPLTAAGVPRKKPGRKPGAAAAAAAAKKAAAAAGAPVEGSSINNTEAPTKQRKPRKPRDPNAPPVQRKRKAPPTEADGAPDRESRSFSTGPETLRQPKITELASMRMDLDPPVRPQQAQQQPPPPAPKPTVKRESMPGSMRNILNEDSPPPQLSPPQRTSGQSYDPVRSNYDPVRETMLARDPYGTGPLGSPRAPSQMPNRASASPSIASLVDPVPTTQMRSPPVPNQPFGRFPESASTPTSPSTTVRNASFAATTVPAHRPAPPVVPPANESKQSAPAAEIKPAQETKETKAAPEGTKGNTASVNTKTKTASTEGTKSKTAPASEVTKATRKSTGSAIPSLKAPPVSAKGSDTAKSTSSAASKDRDAAAAAPASAPSKKVHSMVLQERKQQKGTSSVSSPRASGVAMPPIPDFPDDGNERSILDFGKVNPADKKQAPSIVLEIALNGETNKYVNFMRMAEDKYGWDALHPREAAHRDRKARIAAAASALEKNEKAGSGRETGDEETDQESGGDESNAENGNAAAAAASGPDGAADDAPAKKIRRKRNFKEDEYDKEDDFVDDSEMLWEEQAAASKDGFFVYSGPLIPEVEKPAPGSEGPPKRGRGGRGSRGGATRASTRGGGSGRGTRGGGPGSRGGATGRKPRITKLEKEQIEREKQEREKQARLASTKPSSNSYGLGSPSPNVPLSSAMVIDL
ncbi:hypothetical protein MAPG_03794 [Magnaporthiopsis poae ATCC 64411]|uniref:Hpc2-related domain-containing protein n=1 Tax=Magnaporthiopsis poae (strain ATCC 64411 / 73-15) TaxID=644358 RepID=A0A0C4DUZ9_MAGP6|nr:hypothetical protein MAPG_03794 [Magnaporthiopsis poae ATCC 64411]